MSAFMNADFTSSKGYIRADGDLAADTGFTSCHGPAHQQCGEDLADRIVAALNYFKGKTLEEIYSAKAETQEQK